LKRSGTVLLFNEAEDSSSLTAIAWFTIALFIEKVCYRESSADLLFDIAISSAIGIADLAFISDNGIEPWNMLPDQLACGSSMLKST